MAFLTDQDRRDILSGDVPADGGGPIVVPGSGGVGGEVAGSSAAPPPSEGTLAPSRPVAGAPHLGELQGSIEGLRGGLGEARQGFESQLPEAAQFTEQDRADLTSFATNPFSAASPEQLSRYRGFVDSSYSGPSGLDEEKTRGLGLQADSLREAGLAAGRGQGAVAYARQANPGLTRGEAIFNLRQGTGLEDFRTQGRDLASAASGFQEDLNTARDEALSMASQRGQSFADRAGQARDLLGGIRQGVDTSEAQRLEEFNAQEDQLLEAYRQLQETGDVSSIAPFVQEEQQGAFETIQGDERLRAEADAAAQQIMDRYPDIKDYSLAEYDVDKKGRTRWLIRTPTGRTLWLYKDYEHFPRGVGQQLVARQKEIDALFAANPAGTGNRSLDENRRKSPYRGIRGDLDKWTDVTRPLLKAADFVDLQRSPVEASAADIRTEEDAATLQRIADLLGSGEQYQAGSNLVPRFNIREGEFTSGSEGLQNLLEGAMDEADRQLLFDQRKRNRKRNENKFKIGNAALYGLAAGAFGVPGSASLNGAVIEALRSKDLSGDDLLKGFMELLGSPQLSVPALRDKDLSSDDGKKILMELAGSPQLVPELRDKYLSSDDGKRILMEAAGSPQLSVPALRNK